MIMESNEVCSAGVKVRKCMVELANPAVIPRLNRFEQNIIGNILCSVID